MVEPKTLYSTFVPLTDLIYKCSYLETSNLFYRWRTELLWSISIVTTTSYNSVLVIHSPL